MRRLAILLLLLCTTAQAELTVVNPPRRDHFCTVTADAPGTWVVVGPGATLGGSQLIIGCAGRTCNFVGPPGQYLVIHVPKPGEQAYDQVTLVIPDGPKPDPEPDPKPDPDPTQPFVRLVIVEETSERTAQQARTINQITSQYRAYPVLTIDQDAQTASLKPYIAAGKGAGLPAVCFVGEDGKVVGVEKLPASYEAFQELVKSKAEPEGDR